MEARKCDKVSGGLEPIFQHHYTRRINLGKATMFKSASKEAVRAMKKLSSATVAMAPSLSKNYIVNGNFTISQSGDDMEVRYIKREEVKVKIERFNKKYKGKYRFKAFAYAPLYWEDTPDPPGTTSFSASTWGRTDKNQEMKGSEVLSKTRHGAEASAINQLLQQCRSPLTRKQKLENRSSKTEKKHKRYVNVEVRVSNSLDFIMNDDDGKVWHEIRKET